MLNANDRRGSKLLGIRISCAAVIIGLLLLVHPSFAQNDNAALEKILNTMDATAATFKSAQADFEWDTYTAVVNDHDFKVGTIYYRKQGNSVEMSAEVRPSKNDLVQQYILFKNNKVEIYTPKTKQVQSFDATSNKADVQSFLVLGFGGGGHEMLKSFEVHYAGTEHVQGVDAAKLELTPKSASARNMFNKIVLWIDPKLGVSVQQQLFASGGDYKLSKYSNIKLNPKLSDDLFKLKRTS
jgi:outer membrane lipoprotein-sorting protein